MTKKRVLDLAKRRRDRLTLATVMPIVVAGDNAEERWDAFEQAMGVKLTRGELLDCQHDLDRRIAEFDRLALDDPRRLAVAEAMGKGSRK